ncbi:4-methylaminobutanoate oxidase (formaldehyde-forming) [Stieleria maiorica]|uniref:4-methylaminobutanoate oxidase (Formaldehyde-forming) n=1 Tax=Stieleria maiorica TaxID=2795974 RepID=A0A5B9MBX7_9BACT|nr:TIGR03364 family FAD-dependent oxidoreductase [Stieleria maiorica]QEF97104.1 4-methylaminobutanoate oxidase (formaldehyde-forming) [Stieleria maiorica]
MDSDNKYDLIVVGAGVLGTFHAYEALRRGKRVLLVDKNSRPVGATVRNFGQVVPSGMDTAWQRLGRDSLDIYKSIQAEFDLSVRHEGSIYLASDAEETALIEELHAINRCDGYHSQLWTKQQCKSRYPLLCDSYCRAGLFFPDEVSVDPRKMVLRLHDYLREQLGLTIAMSTCVQRLDRSSSDSVTAHCTDGRTFQSEKAIVCSGVEFGILFPELFQCDEIETVKLQMVMLAAQSPGALPGNVLTGHSIRRYESFAACPSYHSIKEREDPDSLWRKWGVHILFKQEVDGHIILGDSHEYAPTSRADELSFDLQMPINRFFVSQAQQIMGLANWDIQRTWAGMYCQSKHPSGIFQRTLDDDIHIATAIGGKGMTGSAGFAKQHLKEIYGD